MNGPIGSCPNPLLPGLLEIVLNFSKYLLGLIHPQSTTFRVQFKLVDSLLHLNLHQLMLHYLLLTQDTIRLVHNLGD